jgi:hypothetical protein
MRGKNRGNTDFPAAAGSAINPRGFTPDHPTPMSTAGQKLNVRMTPSFHPMFYPPEILEARIAPAVFFLSADFLVKTASGAVVPGVEAAAAAAGSEHGHLSGEE